MRGSSGEQEGERNARNGGSKWGKVGVMEERLGSSRMGDSERLGPKAMFADGEEMYIGGSKVERAREQASELASKERRDGEGVESKRSKQIHAPRHEEPLTHCCQYSNTRTSNLVQFLTSECTVCVTCEGPITHDISSLTRLSQHGVHCWYPVTCP